MSAPFLLLSAHTRAFLLPGLPAAALMAFCPMLAALVVAWSEGRIAVVGLLRRAYDFRRITDKVWYVPILLFYPAITVLSYGAICWSGVRLPPPQIDVLNISGLAVAFFVAAMGEEIGWSGYATDRLQRRFGALVAALILGAIWAIYHVAALRLAHRAWSWIGWWALHAVAVRLIMIWIFNNTGKSVCGAALFHMTLNVCWQTFPVNGAYFNFRITGVITACAACLIVLFPKKSGWRTQLAVGLAEGNEDKNFNGN
jgi:uncharacterized protein